MNLSPSCFFFFFFNDTATTEIYTLSLHDALPISALADGDGGGGLHRHRGRGAPVRVRLQAQRAAHGRRGDEAPRGHGTPGYPRRRRRGDRARDHLVRALRVPRIARVELRAARLRERVSQGPPPGGV